VTPPEALRGRQNKARDVYAEDDLAALTGWLGQGYRYPEGPPWPWDDLLPDERSLFEHAVARLTLVLVPRRVAYAMCWSEGRWRETCQKIVNAADVQAFPARKHVRLIPKPSLRALLGIPELPRPS
jgi:hypothetical protein